MYRMLFVLLVLFSSILSAAEKPALLLAELYQDSIDVRKYWVSEKLDGVRAYWDGKQLISRGGHVIAAPEWFVADFPAQKLDGELWLGRSKFAETLCIVSKQIPVDSEWRQLSYYIFELPDADGTFTSRVRTMQALVQQQNSEYLTLVPQFRLVDHNALHTRLTELEQAGAEGLMLHQQDALYKTGRSSDLLKLKTYQDAEAEVTGYRPGKGKYQGMVGALIVKTPDGKTFAIGSGLTDALRQSPPAIGTVVTYRYNGFTKNGLPRFARFLRLRHGL